MLERFLRRFYYDFVKCLTCGRLFNPKHNDGKCPWCN
jgi:rubrerythrin